jgi:hypothetical protein
LELSDWIWKCSTRFLQGHAICYSIVKSFLMYVRNISEDMPCHEQATIWNKSALCSMRSMLCNFVCMMLWHTHPLLGNDCEMNSETMAIARQQLPKYATVLKPLLGSGPCITVEILLEAVFSMGPFQGYIIRPTELR